MVQRLSSTKPSRRSKLEVHLDVLKIIGSGTHKPTQIMHRANISWKPLVGVLDTLVAQGLISVAKDSCRRRYEATEKGKNVLQYFRDALSLIEIR